MITVTGSDLDDVRRAVSAPANGFLTISFRRWYANISAGEKEPGFIIHCDLAEVPLVFKTVEETLAYIETVLRKAEESRTLR